MSDRDGRPTPEALLKSIQQDRRGKLKIFLGAAPGVGKTYEMLTAAHQRKREGVDVVIGVVETHGRVETEAMVADLETLPRQKIDYKGRVLDEMDIDAILARKPALVLVDELAHTNAPGSRHAKRYQDVEEILAAGIDVYSTLNIQHVESLNDVVAQITRIRVRETVPDSVIDTAAEIEVIDLTPDDLIQRLREGKVYVAKTANRALGHYFSAGNLTALRELALRRTAQRVDAQLLDHMQAHAIQGPWAAGDRVLVCIDHRDGAKLVRYGRRMAERLRVPWTALHIETVRDRELPDSDRDQIAETLRMAERLGAEAVTMPGSTIAEDVLSYAREHNFTHIVIGHTERQRWWQRSIPEQLLRLARDIPVHVIGTQPEKGDRAVRLPVQVRLAPTPVLASMALVLAATLIGVGLRQVLNSSGIGMVYLTAVLISAATYGLWPSLLACLVSTLGYNFFFLEPLYSFTIADPENVVALFFFTISAIITSNLAARLRAQTVAARVRARTTEELYQFSRKLAGIGNLDDLLWATAYQMAAMLKLRVVLLLPESRESEMLMVRGAYPPEDSLDEADLAAANWAWQSNRPTGRGSDTLPGGRLLFLPLRTGSGPVAIVGIDNDDIKRGPLLTPDQRRLLDALGDQAAVSIERMVLAEDVDRSRLNAEAERLRAALLTSLSHDLRTPLSAILGAASSLQTYRAALAVADQDELLATIAEEAERMGRFVANLLDMTRLESGAVARERQAVDLGELIGSTLARAGKILLRHKVELDFAEDLPILQLDAVLLEQVLFNLLDNAAKYAPSGTTIILRAWQTQPDRSVTLQVIDEGPGIPPELREHVFEKFFRIQSPDGRGDRARAGTGLGLAICRGFVEAMGGRIAVTNRMERSGAVFTVTLPVPEVTS
ncbi:MAG: sensor histidine kinase KdpD [Acetobacteraceae bacterium]|nr:sensor histidine kinase KdpD [Acetobacteraceae bacterium]